MEPPKEYHVKTIRVLRGMIGGDFSPINKVEITEKGIKYRIIITEYLPGKSMLCCITRSFAKLNGYRSRLEMLKDRDADPSRYKQELWWDTEKKYVRTFTPTLLTKE
ncbi:hypothetical protein HXX01_01865 [Candidatus Nomurabacteria bacterium]|nr:hypothetical protein [Candidatus Nomurabacteria bacterium]